MQAHSESSFPWFGVLASLAIVAVVAVLVWVWQSNSKSGETLKVEQQLSLPETPEPADVFVEEVVEAAVEVELDDSETSLPEQQVPVLPRLNESDAAVKEKVTELDGGARLLTLLVNDELIRKTVRAVHSLSEGWVVKEYRPVNSPKGRYIVTDTGRYDAQQQKIYETSYANYDRYKTHIDVLTALPPESVASLYRHFYPLMQQAYDELGLQKGGFHTVMLAALDQILASPVFPSDQSLRQPSVMYVYADNSVENLSSLEKLKLRIGSENAAALRAWVRGFRQQLSSFKG